MEICEREKLSKLTKRDFSKTVGLAGAATARRDRVRMAGVGKGGDARLFHPAADA